MKRLLFIVVLLVFVFAMFANHKLVSPLVDDGIYDPDRIFPEYSADRDERPAVVNVPGDYTSIQEAIDAVDNYGTVHIETGTHSTTALTIAKPLTLEGSGSETILQFTSYVTTSDSKKAVIYVNSVGPDEFVNFFDMTLNVIEDIGIQGSAGSAVHILETSCLMDGLVIDFNEWVWGGIYSKDMNPEHNAEFTATNCSVTGILKNGITANGAGLTVTLTGNTIYGPTIPCPVYTGNIAGNGLQIGYGASGSINNNIIYDFYSDDDTYGACGILTYNTSYDIADNEIEMNNNSIYDCESAMSAVEDYGLIVTMENNNIYWNEMKLDPANDDNVYSPSGIDVSRYMHVNNSSFTANVSNNNIVRYPACDSMEVTGYYIGGGEAFGWPGYGWTSYIGDAPITFNLESTTLSGISKAFRVYAATKLIEINLDNVDLMLNTGYGVSLNSYASTLVNDEMNARVNFTNSTFTCTDSGVWLLQIWKKLISPGSSVIENNDFSGMAGGIVYNYVDGEINAEYNYWGVADPSTKVYGSVDVSPWYTDAAMTELAHPAPQNVTLAKAGTTVTLDWDAWDSESVTETYAIYKTTGDPYSADGWTAIETGIPNGTYSKELTNQTEDYAYYRVVLTGDTDYIQNDVIGYYTIGCDITATTDLNFISVPLETEYTTASDYVDNVIGSANCNTISKWVVASQSWQTATYVSELTTWFGDFTIEENGAYLMGCLTDDLSYTVTGGLPGMPEYTLVNGNNLIMVPLDVAAGTSARTFYDDEFDLEAGDTISLWDVANQGWSTTNTYNGSQWEGTPFNVNPGDPVMAGE